MIYSKDRCINRTISYRQMSDKNIVTNRCWQPLWLSSGMPFHVADPSSHHAVWSQSYPPTPIPISHPDNNRTVTIFVNQNDWQIISTFSSSSASFFSSISSSWWCGSCLQLDLSHARSVVHLNIPLHPHWLLFSALQLPLIWKSIILAFHFQSL